MSTNINIDGIPTPHLHALDLDARERRTIQYARGRDAIHADANEYLEEKRRHNQAAASTIYLKQIQKWVPQMKKALVDSLGGEQRGGFVIFRDPDGTERHAKY